MFSFAAIRQFLTSSRENPLATPSFDGTYDFIPLQVMTFLDPKSLVQFGATNKHLLEGGLLQKEIARRKQLVKEYEGKIHSLVGVAGDERKPYTRDACSKPKNGTIKRGAW